MKKLVVLLISLLVSAPLFASLSADVERAVLARTKNATPAWQQQLSQLQQSFAKVNKQYDFTSRLPAVQHETLILPEQHTYLQRMVELQRHMHQHKALSQYAFVAPVPTDLAQFSAGNYALLVDFLRNVSLVQVSYYIVRPFTLALKINSKHNSLELWIDVPTRRVYLMSNNLYSSASEKYGLHLK